jgi:hypothetical protein
MICPGAVAVQALNGPAVDLSEDMRDMMIAGPHARRISGAHKPPRGLDLELHSQRGGVYGKAAQISNVAGMRYPGSSEALPPCVLGSAGVDIDATRDKAHGAILGGRQVNRAFGQLITAGVFPSSGRRSERLY